MIRVGALVLDLDATLGPASAVGDVVIVPASVRALRRMSVGDRDQLARCNLAPREVARYQALAPFSKRQLEWLAGRLAAKRSVAELLARGGARPEARELEILQERDAGPPYVACAGVHVSISHSFDVALGAAAPHIIGIDVELVRPLAAELADYAFAADELDAIGTDETAMVRLWTMKESFVKMLGLGVASFDDVQLVACKDGEPWWSVRGRVADELGARQARCWADIASGYAIALTWPEPRLAVDRFDARRLDT